MASYTRPSGNTQLKTSHAAGPTFGWWPEKDVPAGVNAGAATGDGGKYYNGASLITIGQMPAAASRPFWLLIVLCAPNGSLGLVESTLTIGTSGTGPQLDIYTTGGGTYAGWTARGTANGAVTYRDTTAFNTTTKVLVTQWTATGQESRWYNGDSAGGTNQHIWSDTLGYTAAGSPQDVIIHGTRAGVYAVFGGPGTLDASGTTMRDSLGGDPYQLTEAPASGTVRTRQRGMSGGMQGMTGGLQG